ncbi:outer membrane protein assembly factor BamB family protein [Botrimarina hoheduenensis]|uniref:Outer membrane biogenesis protein BamB n=1 Tax=Botrimarina hoheduenensis TaxID=2528000 RepID=A0A5C5VWG1_9BACT|nr:PQQ-binding-like beta-propeller repeat protein [Botrimarina hoheduenensis]TWT42958.1 outer membrane biogenesis protein BamB [Botrimarina hoheduenensis]
MFTSTVVRLTLCGSAFAGSLIVASESLAVWPQWRGPLNNAAVPSGDYPIRLSVEENLAWQVDLPGPGASTPIVSGDLTNGRLYVTCEIEGEDALVAYDLSGTEVWRQQFGPRRESKHRNATGANSSPVTDGKSVFCYYKSGLLVAVDTEGEEKWRRQLQEEYGADTLWWDLGTSPVLTPAGVLVAVMQAGESYLVTFDRQTGETVWKTQRVFERPQESDQAYTTPALVETEHGPTVIVWGADFLTGHDPSTGEEWFRCGGFNPDNTPMWRAIASATIDAGTAIVPFGRGDFIGAVRLGGRGDVTTTHRLWTAQGVGSDVPSPVVSQGRSYILGDKGEVACLNTKTGAVLWRERLPRSKNKYFSSPLLAGDLLYVFREDGVGFTLRVSDDSAPILSEHDMGEEMVASPVPLGDGRIVVRTRTRLYCFSGENRR